MQKSVAVLGGGIGGLSACYHLSKSSQVSKVRFINLISLLLSVFNFILIKILKPFCNQPIPIQVRSESLNAEYQPIPIPIGSDYLSAEYQPIPISIPKRSNGVVTTIPPFSRPIILSVLKEVLVSKGKEEDESVHAFVTRRLGSELADIAIDALCRGVFAGDSRKLSVRSCFPPLYTAEQSRGSIVLGMLLGSGKRPPVDSSALVRRAQKERWAQWSLRRGIQALPEALEEVLRGRGQVEVHKHAPVRRLDKTAAGWEIKLEDGITLKADHVISALPASALASVLPPAAEPLSKQLLEIPTATVGMVNLEFSGSVLPVTGFGHLVPSSEDRGLLGVVYDSIPFPQHNHSGEPSTRLTVMMGGAWFEEVFGDPDKVTEQVLMDRASEAVRKHLSITHSPTWSKAAVLKNCIPQYHVGHWKRLEMMRRFISDAALPLTLTGASYDGVSVNDVIMSGRDAAEGLVGKV
uniref:Protoporphyrinogen oxidase n=1 Tax=Astyanax mexicanus TaxID=7994 RepID=W5KTG1_ASTMX